jgi:hypothetical protein
MTDHSEESFRPARPALSDFATEAAKRSIVVDPPPDYEKAMAAIRPLPGWLCLLAVLALAGGAWGLVISLAWLMLK